MRRLGFLLLLVLPGSLAYAGPLTKVNVAAPAINCVFDPSCTVVVTDTTAPIPLVGAAGTAFLQTRTFQGQPGSPASGLYAYRYRIDLQQAYGILGAPCVVSLAVDFGPVVTSLDYNGDGASGDQVYVITRGGLGSVAPTLVSQSGSVVSFAFGSTPVCAGQSPGTGESSFFIGLTAKGAPKDVTVTLQDSTAKTYSVQARAPSYVGFLKEIYLTGILFGLPEGGLDLPIHPPNPVVPGQFLLPVERGAAGIPIPIDFTPETLVRLDRATVRNGELVEVDLRAAGGRLVVQEIAEFELGEFRGTLAGVPGGTLGLPVLADTVLTLQLGGAREMSLAFVLASWSEAGLASLADGTAVRVRLAAVGGRLVAVRLEGDQGDPPSEAGA